MLKEVQVTLNQLINTIQAATDGATTTFDGVIDKAKQLANNTIQTTNDQIQCITNFFVTQIKYLEQKVNNAGLDGATCLGNTLLDLSEQVTENVTTCVNDVLRKI